jgi:negative regulator of flagellin synthesis FlgM
MSDIPPIQSAGQMAGFASQRVAPSKLPLSDGFDGDHLEISETGQLLSELGNNSGIRAEKVAEIRQAIADGTYETEDKLDITVDRLLDVLRTTSVTA